MSFLKSTRVHRYLVGVAGVVVAAGSSAAFDSAVRSFAANHAWAAVWIAVLAPAATLAYRELVVWRKKNASAPAAPPAPPAG